MARSLLHEGFAVRVWNRTPEKAEPLADDGAVVAPNPGEAVKDADVVVLMLFDVGAVLDVLRQAAAERKPEAVILQSSTIGPKGMATVAELADELHLQVLDAPVLGTKQPAEQGKLVVLASGDPALRPTAAAVFGAIGSRTVWVGDELGQASALKLACNAWVATITAGTAQSLAMARSSGLDPQLVLDALDGGPTDTPYLHVKGKAMMEKNYDVSFALDGVRKDLDLMKAAASDSGVNSELLDALRSTFASAADKGHGDHDMAAVITAF
jgi:3-hydroxyisobutyrate dehydrogenase